jgi:hypothetical protein
MISISMTILPWSLTIKIILKMTFQNSITSLFSDYPGKKSASCNQKILSGQHLENVSRQLNWPWDWCNNYILSIRRSLLSQATRLYTSLRVWHLRWYSIKHLTDWILLLIYIITSGCIQTKQVSNWLHGVRGSPLIAVMIHDVHSKYTWLPFRRGYH